MADGASFTKPQRLASTITAQNKKNPSKFYSRFLFKALSVALFLVIIPLFPSEAPEFVSPSIFNRGWELLHLIFVGIAVSYGLFSRRNDDSEGEHVSKFDNAQSYMSRLLQVPSVFDDEIDSPSGSDDNCVNKVQTWSSQYYRNRPTLVVAQKGTVVDDKSRIAEKPLLLPVRSLKSRVSDGSDVELAKGGNSGVSKSYTRSNSNPSSKRLSKNSETVSRNAGGLVGGEESGVSKAYARSNSSPSARGFSNDSKRMSRNGSGKSRLAVPSEFGYSDEDGGLSRSFSNPRKTISGKYGDWDDEEMIEQGEKSEETVVLPSPIPWRSRSGRMEFKVGSDDFASFSLQPPSLEEIGPTRSMKSRPSRSSQSSSSSSSPTKLSPSPASSPKKPSSSPSMESESLAKSVEDYGRRKIVYSSHLPPPPPPPLPPPPRPILRSRLVKSSSASEHEQISSHQKEFKQRVWSEPRGMSRESIEANAINGTQSSLMGKSVSTVRPGETTEARKTREIMEEGINEVEVEEPERKTTGYNPMSTSSFSEFPKETRDFLDEVLVETDYESESEDENYGESRVETEKLEEAAPSSSLIDEGPDVDKKADEFIAKFREQIRLQRIESIKRSTGQLKRNSVR